MAVTRQISWLETNQQGFHPKTLKEETFLFQYSERFTVVFEISTPTAY